MSIEKLTKIDAVGIDKITKDVILTITDHLDWENIEDHLILLQDKLNLYIDFYESGKLYKVYPHYKEKKIIFNVLGKFLLPKEGEDFYARARKVLSNIEIELRFVYFPKES